MNYALILAGGTGNRMKTGNLPKQYIMVNGKPVISYCLRTFEQNHNIDSIVIIADSDWHDFIDGWISRGHITKFTGYAAPGSSRQHSIYNGLLFLEKNACENDIVIIHDAARPFVSDKIINACIQAATEADGGMPVIPVKDTIYRSRSGSIIDGLLNRDELFAGQAPESFRFKKYLKIHKQLSIHEINSIRGSSEIAVKYGMNIKLVEGDDRNYKLTTPEDLNNFRNDLLKENQYDEGLCFTGN